MINKTFLIGLKTIIEEKINYYDEELYPTKYRDYDYTVEANRELEGRIKAYDDVLEYINEVLGELEETVNERNESKI